MNYRNFLSFLFTHLDQVGTISQGVEKVLSAQGAVAKWTAFKPVGDVLAADIEFLTAPAAAGVEDEATLEVKVCEALNARPTAAGVEAKKWDGERLKAIWSVVGPFITTFGPILIGLIPK